MKKRSDFSDELKWNVEDLFINIDEFNKCFKALEEELPKYKKFKGHIMDNSNTLYDLLSFDTDINKRLEKIYIYAHINNDQDTSDVLYQTLFGKAHNLYLKYIEASSYIIPELLEHEESLVLGFIKENKKLEEYEITLKNIFKAKSHILSTKEEELISNISPIFSSADDIFSSLTDTDLKFGKIRNEDKKLEELNEQSYRKFIESSNRNVRKNAFKKLLNTYGSFKNTYAMILSKEVKKHNSLAKIRKYNSALEASLFSDEIPCEIYTNLISNVKKNIKPLSKFWKLKKEAIHVSKLHLYDASAPLINDVKKEYSVLEAKEILKKSLSVLGNDYITNLMKAFDEKWIDFCPNTGKRGGAYCTSCYTVHPYVLLSYDGSLNSVSTLAHELGHAMHYYYAIKNQKFQDYNYSIFVAEVASQVNQILLSKYLIENTTDKEIKKYLLDDLIRDFKATIYRQTMFADFELQIHELESKGEVLTNEVLNDLYYKLNKVYFGKNIIVDKEIQYEWARIPHFYMNFYVYQYATAYQASIIIALNILENKKNALDKYLEFLSLGSTKNPIESLKIAGVDMTNNETINIAFTYFNDLVESLQKLYETGEING